MKFKKVIYFAVLAMGSIASNVQALSLSSTDIVEGKTLGNAQVFNGFGCEGENISPALSWSDIPEGTKSFAITAYDPDAPTGSGWWHWQMINIPVSVTSLASGAGDVNGKNIPQGSRQIKNDFGVASYGGACPPIGHGTHHYRFMLHALSVEKIDLPEDPSGALTGYMINANSIATAHINAIYQR